MKNLPNGWKKVELSEILESIENGNRPKGGITDLKDGIPSIGGEHINSTGGFNLKNVRLIPYDFYSSMKRGKIQQEDVLVVKDGATTGKVSLVGGDFPYEDAAVNEHVFILRGKKDLVHQKFLFYHLYSPIGQRQMDANFHGAAIGGINTQFVKNYNLVLPPLPTQIKIAAVLEKAERLREWRKEADGLTDKFLKSTFLEMFGDPVSNPKGWEYKKLMELGNWQSGGTPSRSNGDYFKGDIPWYTAGELNSLFVYASIEKITQDAIKESSTKLIAPNNLLLGMYDTAALKSSITTVECACNQAIVFSKLEYGLANIFYLFYVIHVARKHYMRQQRGVRQKNLNLSMIRNLEVPVPPIELQNKFANIVQQVEQIREHQTQSRQHIENFFNVLMQRAFSGELEAK